MATFKVQCFNGGITDGNGWREVDADDPRSAAEKVCGCRVRGERGKPGELCALVRSNEAKLSSPPTIFYADQNLN